MPAGFVNIPELNSTGNEASLLSQMGSEIIVDLFDLNLEYGDRIITVKLSADGYETSEFSNAVTYTARPNMTTEPNATGTTVKFRRYYTADNENGTTVIIR